jgi:hypothetical protein
MNHIMLDLETLDTVSSAVVISIGAVAFDPYTNELGDKFYVELTDDVSGQQKHGRTISGDTVRWWMQQDVLAKRVFADPPPDGVERVSTLEALSRFGLFVAANGDRDVELWGNGADFDNIILGSLYDAFGLRKPWSYSRNRCYRTMKNIGIGPRKPRVREGVHHNALDDAITQATHLQEIFACLNPR